MLAIRHGDRVALAMDARAFGTVPRSSYREVRWSRFDLGVAIGSARALIRRCARSLDVGSQGAARVPSCRVAERGGGGVVHDRVVTGDARTIVFFPEGAFGPTNNCVGIGQVLRARGHRVVFIVEESFAGTLEAKGFEERLMRLGPKPEVEEVPGQFWIDFIRDTAPVFRKPTIVQLEEFIAPTWGALIEGAKYVDARLTEIIDELAPDAIVEDNVVGFPALAASGRPWVRIVSCNPAELKDPAVPPFSSGYPAADRGDWPAFLAEVERTHRDLWTDFDAFCREHGDTGLRYGPLGPDFIAESPWLNLYLYPAEVDYARERAARADLASARFVRPRGRHDVGAPGPPARARRRADLPLAGQPRLGRRRADAAPGRPPGDHRAPGHRLRRARSPTRSPSTTTRPGRASCRSRRSCRRSTWSSPTAATTRSPRRSTTASR